MAIYTKKGDRGETSVFSSNKRLDKDSVKVEALGAIDELNSFLGVAVSFSDIPKSTAFVENIQTDLFTIASIIAGADLAFANSKTTKLEKKIDLLDKGLPKLTTFVVSGGSRYATHLMYARALSRRAERRVVSLSKIEKVPTPVLKYLNRLSDCLFMLFREANFEAGIEEEYWKGR